MDHKDYIEFITKLILFIYCTKTVPNSQIFTIYDLIK